MKLGILLLYLLVGLFKEFIKKDMMVLISTVLIDRIFLLGGKLLIIIF